ncbi:ADP-ribosyl-[dinitrogen reductase] hydrolase [Parabacteroides sp. PF5-5]|uniref:ADP-ribosylglycohydrolase family protein n=1 Tax=unclassified Parabacteroides TaxID=2649774 RepID=UPI00247430E0|nr:MULTISPECIES: ADP-ribosylglycohydrolase family protein [unclassified Parabacteroides]MDH6304838.1 ADP-ribosyl-[dinitrogen reductase] hydrolase [Parabacteroides sp. PH5-39]MDH6316076.1 ADP-ribosyl-[dinitrogen reductase] hydrolase [Parabacteroides sp. PF5-13]MDH6319733.1 ADP-ribosyl-[dinitrogen reductase] hydrolase [Parabacteroides sp. PH5-13]MDH6323464.1 ADP-ribosyl-[dinitrogen reductase] hydrolase [Parabacteroides sp. PH5-8]MDH6327028.1 ADP-ribosyl-[dinitrogen reductase] hydrolase [Parabact
MNSITNSPPILLGAIAGDIIGSKYEFSNIHTLDFPLFDERNEITDDTVMTVAVGEWLLTGESLSGIMQDYGWRYPNMSYGSSFRRWLLADDPQPYNSWGNGSAMRVSLIGWAFDTLEETLDVAKASAVVTHNHPEGIKGAQATATCVYLARMGSSKEQIKAYIENTFGYDLQRTCNQIRPTYHFNESCQGTVPEAIIAFLESNDFEHAIRLGISLGGDSDTLAAITGGIAEAYYKVIPEHIQQEVIARLPGEFIEVLRQFCYKFIANR